MTRPIGVTVVAALTLLSTFALAFIFLVFFAVSQVGGAGASGGYAGSTSPLTLDGVLNRLSALLQLFLPLFFAFFSFALSVAILTGATSKYLWYSSLAYWTALFAYFVWTYTYMGIWHYMFYLEGGEAWFSWYSILSFARILSLPSPFIYAGACSIYFLTKKPREYFHIKCCLPLYSAR